MYPPVKIKMKEIKGINVIDERGRNWTNIEIRKLKVK
jgi:hypothetical protein